MRHVGEKIALGFFERGGVFRQFPRQRPGFLQILIGGLQILARAGCHLAGARQLLGVGFTLADVSKHAEKLRRLAGRL